MKPHLVDINNQNPAVLRALESCNSFIRLECLVSEVRLLTELLKDLEYASVRDGKDKYYVVRDVLEYKAQKLYRHYNKIVELELKSRRGK